MSNVRPRFTKARAEMSCENGSCKDCATIQGAIAYFKGCRDGDWNDPCQGTLSAYLNMAIDALEKQVPKSDCTGCKIYADLQRYHWSQEQCSGCKGCIRIATDRYQKEQ